MQLGEALAGLRHVAQIGCLIAVLYRVFARREQALLFDKAIQMRDPNRPEVALIDDHGMQNRDGAALVALDQFGRAEQSGSVRETDHFGEEAAHFDLRIDADLELPVDLGDIFVVDQRG